MRISQLLTWYFEELKRSLTGNEEMFERALRQAQAGAQVGPEPKRLGA